MLRKLDSKLIIHTYDEFGKELPDQRQVIRNSPIAEIEPDLDVVIIQAQPRELAEGDQELGAQATEFSIPIKIGGKAYRRDWVWGSAVKQGRTFGLREDLFTKNGILTVEEDRYRIGRAYFANSSCGLRGKLTVGTVPEKYLLAGKFPVADGFGYIRRSIAEQMEPKFRKIQTGKWQNASGFLQRYQLTKTLWEELQPHYHKNLIEVLANGFELVSKYGSTGSMKTRFAIDSEMEMHPFISNAVSEARAQRMFRVATAGGILTEGGLCVPTVSKKLVLPKQRFTGESEKIAGRWPIDGWGSIRAVQTETDQAETDRISEMEVIQYSLTVGYECSGKGMLGIIDDEHFPPGVDIIACNEDEKLNASWVNKIDREPKLRTFDDAVLSVAQWYEAGSAFGTPYWLAKAFNGDYDGDNMFILDGDEFPELLRQTKAFPSQPNPKLPKSRTRINGGGAMKALLSMSNLVGIATNITSTCLAIADQEWVARQCGYADAMEMHEFLMYAIKVGTDNFKTSVDSRPVHKKLARLQQRLNSLGISAPWTKWKSHPLAFRHELPVVDVAPNDVSWERKDLYVLPLKRAKGVQNAIVPTILRWILPQMIMPDTTPIKPLAYFKDWAIKPTGKYDELAHQLLRRYALRIKALNFSDPAEWNSFVDEWQAALSDLVAEKGLDAWLLANALWHVSHEGQRMSEASKVASAAFVGLPDEVDRIIRERPGKKETKQFTLNGIHHQLPNPEKGAVVSGKVVPFIEPKTNGMKLERLAFVVDAPLDGQRQPKNAAYPHNMLAVVAIQDFPTGETFKVRLDRQGKSWLAEVI